MIKKTLSALLSIAICITMVCCILPSVDVYAASGEMDCGPTWKYSNGTLTISGEGYIDSWTYWEDYLDSITKVVINSGVEEIWSYAFAYMNKLTSISIPDTVTWIGGEAFFECKSLKTITVSSKNEFYRVKNGVLFEIEDWGDGEVDYYRLVLYPAASTATSYTIPDSVEEIDSYAFAYAKNLQKINAGEDCWFESRDGVLMECDAILAYPAGKKDKSYTAPEDKSWIYPGAFMGASYLETLNFTCLYDIPEDAFYDCSKLKAVNVEAYENISHVAEGAFSGTAYYNTASNWKNNVLYWNEWLIESKYNISGKCEVQAGTVGIADYAFGSCRSLEAVTMPEGLRLIGGGAFSYCDKLKELTIPASVVEIGWDAFLECNSLSDIYYGGTKRDWNKIDIDIDSGNEALENATIHYSGQSDEDEDPITVVDSGTCGDNLTWTLDDSGVLTISGTGDMTDYSWDDSPFFDNGDIKLIVIGNGVTSIGDYAFCVGSSLTSVEIPDSVTSIGESAFGNCSNLTSVEIPDSVTSIGDGAFSSCRSLTSVEIPNSVTSIGDGAFSGCRSLTSVEIPDGVTSIGKYVFEYCSNLASVNIGNSVTSIGECAFSNCSNLTSVEIPDSVTSIGNWAFEYCLDLTSVNIGNSVTSIGGGAFSECVNLTSVEIPDSVASIGSGAFYDCWRMTSLIIGNSVTSIGSSAFNECGSLTSVKIPNSVTSIGGYAFYDCLDLTSVEIPSSVTSIGSSAFGGCDSLTDVYYGGSEEEWKNIDIETYNEPLANANIHYNYVAGQPGIGEVSAAVSGDVITITAKTEGAPVTAVLIATGIGADGEAMGAIRLENGRGEMKAAGVKKVKILLWESLSSMKPLCEAKVIEISEQ